MTKNEFLQIASGMICTGLPCADCKRIFGIESCPGTATDELKLEFVKAVIARLNQLEANQPLITEDDILSVIEGVIDG